MSTTVVGSLSLSFCPMNYTACKSTHVSTQRTGAHSFMCCVFLFTLFDEKCGVSSTSAPDFRVEYDFFEKTGI